MKLLLDGKPRNIYFRKDNTAYFKKNGIENDITDYFKKSGGLKKQYNNLLIKTTTNVASKKKMILGGEADFNIPNVFDAIIIENKTGKKCWDIETLKDVCEKLIYIFLLAKIHFNVNRGELFIKEYTEHHKIYIKLLDIIVIHIFNKKSIENLLNGIVLLNSNDKNDEEYYLRSLSDLNETFTSINYDDILNKLDQVKKLTSKYTEDDDCDENSEGFDVVKHHMITAEIFKPIGSDSSKVPNTERYKSDPSPVDEFEKKKKELLETQSMLKNKVLESESKLTAFIEKHTKNGRIKQTKYSTSIKNHTDKYNSDISSYKQQLNEVELELKEVESKLKSASTSSTNE